MSDNIGNRTSASRGGDQSGSNLRTSSYTANNLNEYTQRPVPGYVDVLGTANSNASVMVESVGGWYAMAYRKGEYFRGEVPAVNSSAAVWVPVTNIAVLPGGGSWLKVLVTINCSCGQVVSCDAKWVAKDGWTPLRPYPRFDPAEGNAERLNPQCTVNGGRVHCDFVHRSRIGRLGRGVFNNLFPGVGVPYNWRRIEYVLRCDHKYRIDYYGSFFPTHRAYLGTKSVATWDQSGLAGFMFAGDAADAPGGNFHFERGMAQ